MDLFKWRTLVMEVRPLNVTCDFSTCQYGDDALVFQYLDFGLIIT